MDKNIRMIAVQVMGPAQAFIMTIQRKPKNIAINPAAKIRFDAMLISSAISVNPSALSNIVAIEE